MEARLISDQWQPWPKIAVMRGLHMWRPCFCQHESNVALHLVLVVFALEAQGLVCWTSSLEVSGYDLPEVEGWPCTVVLGGVLKARTREGCLESCDPLGRG